MTAHHTREPSSAAKVPTVIARFAEAQRCGQVVDQMWRVHPSSAFVVRQDRATGEWLVTVEAPDGGR